jgi:hypothetical protein
MIMRQGSRPAGARGPPPAGRSHPSRQSQQHDGSVQAAAVSPRGLRITLALPVNRPPGPHSARELAASIS